MYFYKCVTDRSDSGLDGSQDVLRSDRICRKLRELYENTFEKTLEKVAGTKPAYLKIV
ncbi:MAG: hypothetical protein ACLURP_10960 [Ruminococcus sp.]